MNALKETIEFQNRIIEKPDAEAVALYDNLVDEEHCELKSAETIGNKLKEAADLIVVCVGLITAMGYDAEKILHRVNESNNSKFCINNDEIRLTQDHFTGLGLKTYVKELEGLYGVYAAETKIIGGKQYKEGKLLKAVLYAEVDEAALEAIK